MRKKHIMIDIETMGNKSNSVIMSISAVAFDPNTGEINERVFDEHINMKSCTQYGLKFNEDTILWWLTQSDDARKMLVDGQKNSRDLPFILEQFKNWLYLIADDADTKVSKLWMWGNSPRFDLGIINDAYKVIGEDIPWSFRNERCVRTICGYIPEIKRNEVFEGTAHNGVDDCKHQIKYLIKTLNELKIC